MIKNKSEWHTRASLSPGASGTLRECQQYGDALLSVRYRYHTTERRRIKTVELIVGEVTLPDVQEQPVCQYLARFKKPSGGTALILVESRRELVDLFTKMFMHPKLSAFTPSDWLGMEMFDPLKHGVPKSTPVIVID